MCNSHCRCRKTNVPIWVIFFFNGCFSVAWFIYGGVLLFTDPGNNCVSVQSFINSSLMTWL